MPRFGIGQRSTAFGFAGIGALALVALQPVIGAVAFAQTAPATMNAAVSTGQFEELVKPTPVPTIAPTPVPTAVPTPAPTVTPKPPVFESGVASTYGEGDGFEGNRTACGQIFHTHRVQVAHQSLPCGTMIRVEDSDTGRSVDVEVTDRGPYITGRIVDLSWAAFSQLDPSAPGLLHVNVYLLDN
jgi:rare lipoprotein A (peptidoglycan hydrolase)